MDDLVEWLRVQLDEHEARVRALPAGPWTWENAEDSTYTQLAGPNKFVLCSGDAEGYESWIDRHEAFDAYLQDIQPARALSEIDAKRKIIAECAHWHAQLAQEAVRPSEHPFPALGEVLDAVTPILRALALPYADRPGYQEGWRP